MADDKVATPVEASPAVEDTPAPATEVSKEENPAAAAPESQAEETAEAVAPAADKEALEETAEAPAKVNSEDKPAEDADTEMKDAEPAQADTTDDAGVVPPPAVEAAAAPKAAEDTATPSKSSSSRRKSTGPTLKKKQSKVRITHLDAKPGDYYFVKLKGSSPWPAIIADEEILTPEAIKRRPVSAMRPDGTYREDFADGGKRVYERRYPVMYLCTNDFQWVVNTDLVELDPEAIKEVKTDKMKKDLRKAYELAIKQHPLDYYKKELQEFEENLREQEEAEAEAAEVAAQAEAEKAAKAAKAQAATPAKKSKKSKAKVDEDEDLEMPDAEEEEEEAPVKKSSKKRKAEGTAETPQRTESVKKPKIKLTTNSTPKTNGAAFTFTPKATKATESKSAKPKTKKTNEAQVEKEMSVPKEPEYTPEERRARKEKEVLFLRHKLQKGLLTRDQEPKEEEMNTMSEYILKLENLPDLEVSIIRATKINKVLKAIIKMDSIPKEDEFNFKSRSQALLDQWNKILAADEPSNGVNGTSSDSKAKQTHGTNGVKEKSDASPEAEKEAEKESPKATEKEAPKDTEEASKETEEALKGTEKPKEATASADEKPATSEEAKDAESVAADA